MYCCVEVRKWRKRLITVCSVSVVGMSFMLAAVQIDSSSRQASLQQFWKDENMFPNNMSIIYKDITIQSHCKKKILWCSFQNWCNYDKDVFFKLIIQARYDSCLREEVNFNLIEWCLDFTWSYVSPGVKSKDSKCKTDWHMKYIPCFTSTILKSTFTP